jgi:hypothetical protein
MKPFTILEEGRQTEVDAVVDDGRILLRPEDVERALGWSLKPQGLCKDAACIPVSAASGVVRGGDGARSIDLASFAALLGRPLATDVEAGAAFLGGSARDRASDMRGCLAPDFTLPDLSGRTHSLGDYRGRKALLIAWASW